MDDMAYFVLGYHKGKSESSVIQPTTAFEALKKLTPLCTVELADGWSVGFAYDMDINPKYNAEMSYYMLADGSQKLYRSSERNTGTPYLLYYLNNVLKYAYAEENSGIYMRNNYGVVWNEDFSDFEPYRYGREIYTPKSAEISSFTMSSYASASAHIEIKIAYDRTYTSFDEQGNITNETVTAGSLTSGGIVSNRTEGYTFTDAAEPLIWEYMFDVHKACAKKFGYIT